VPSLRHSLRTGLIALLLAAALPLAVFADESAADSLKPAAAAGCPGQGANGAACCGSCQENAAKLAAAGEKPAADAPAHECPCQRARRLKEQAARQAQ
jgi:hypothetical protein